MRYLNKIVFINSAHIPYAEVKVDGNVHFVGTQGVGKSTVLRALLFFYNADKLKLGIPREKQSFDAFYFPYPNSYIVYEVVRDANAYFILAFKHRGRVAFRFIDSAYRCDMLMNEQGEVYTEWMHIQQKIDKGVHTSRIIDRYEEYRDIIFGNRHEVQPEFRKYAIAESNKYQNIPRTIQNVFLNTKLDAEFIKNTMISSMTDDEISIDLAYYRSQVSAFEQEYNDVHLWYKTDKHGVVTVRRDADKVEKAYHNLLRITAQIKELVSELVYAFQRDEQRLPLLHQELGKLKEEFARINRLISEESGKYNKQKDGKNRELGAVDARLKEIADKRKFYQKSDILSVVSRIEKEDFVKNEIENKKRYKEELTLQHKSITDKYAALTEKLQLELRTIEATCNEKKNLLQEVFNREVARITQQKEERNKEIYTHFDAESQTVDEKIQTANIDLAVAKSKRSVCQNTHLYANELEACKNKIDQLHEQQSKTNVEKEQKRSKINALRHQAETERQKIEQELQAQLKDLDQKNEKLAQQIATLDELLAQYKGSFYEWLSTHKQGWQQTIGKVVDEQHVLYNNLLHPQLSSQHNDSLFGVDVDLSHIERELRTPDDLKAEKRNAEQEIEENKKRIYECTTANQENIQQIENRYAKQIRDLRMANQTLEANLLQTAQQIKVEQVKMQNWDKRNEEEKQKRLANIDLQISKLQEQLSTFLQEKEKLRNKRNRELKACEQESASANNAKRKDKDSKIEILLQETQEKTTAINSQIEQLKIQESSELAGQGVNTDALQQINDKLVVLQRELDFINNNRKRYFEYLSFKEEWLPEEDKKKEQKRKFENELALLDEKFRLRSSRLGQQKLQFETKIRNKEAEQAQLEKGLTAVDNFKLSMESTTSIEWTTVKPKTSTDSTDQVLQLLKDSLYDKLGKADALKQNVDRFKSYFSTKNTFAFKTQLNTDDDYMAFAQNMCDFIDHDKIEEYSRRLSDRYGDILQRISKEVGNINSYASEIGKIINDINADFHERNFAGVIKEIALRSQPSSDRLMILLNDMKTFNDEHTYDIGELNLFSSVQQRDDTNSGVTKRLFEFMMCLNENPNRSRLVLSDTFKLQFRIKENDNDTGWIEKISNVGSDGTDILVKAMVNIMLINVFKEKVSRKFGDFTLHCMMDEIGKLHPNNVRGILKFANVRNIYLVNSSPISYAVSDYKYTYLLTKDNKSNTLVKALITMKV